MSKENVQSALSRLDYKELKSDAHPYLIYFKKWPGTGKDNDKNK